MVENENDGIGTAPAGGAPTNRDRRPHEPVIEGEVAPAGSDAPKAEAAPQVPSSEAAEATAPESAGDFVRNRGEPGLGAVHQMHQRMAPRARATRTRARTLASISATGRAALRRRADAGSPG